MARKAHTKRWINNIGRFLDSSRQTVFSPTELRDVLNNNRSELDIPSSLSFSKFVAALLAEGQLSEIVLRREGRKTAEGGKKRYAHGKASPYALGLSLARGSYLSHASAMFLHALTDQVPKTIYVNKEQSAKPRQRGALSQPAIDRAFKSSVRVSKYVFVSATSRFVLLSGKNTGRLEVSGVRGPTSELLDTTKIERTLIDIVVRPVYAGGVYEILRAYRSAANRISVNTLLAVLKKLDYVYPYHQSIGFLLERSGVDEKHLAKFERLGVEWNFYLDYKMKKPAFSKRWRLFYPEGL